MVYYMGLWDTFEKGFGKAVEMAEKKNAEIMMSREKLERCSDEELFRYARRGTAFNPDKLAAVQMLKERGYGRH